MTIIPVGPYRPDLVTTSLGVSPVITGCSLIPDPDGGVAYAPLSGFQALATSTAVPATPAGQLTAVTKAGIYVEFVMTASAIYKMSALGVPTSIGSGYNLPAGDKWSACQHSTNAFFTNKNDGLLQYDLELGGAVTAVSGAPKGRIIRSIFDTLMMLDCDGDNKLARNSGFDPTDWTGGVANFQPYTAATELLGIEKINDGQAIVLQRNQVSIINRRGDAQLYDEAVLATNTGAVNPWCIVPAGNLVYFIDVNGVKAAGAGGIIDIGAGKVDRGVIRGMTKADLDIIEGAYDPLNNVIFWRYSDSGLGWTINTLSYYLQFGEFSQAAINFSSMFTGASPGYTMEDLDAFGTMDALTLSLDDRFWYGGLPQLAGLGSDFRYGFMNGSAVAAVIETNVNESTTSALMTSFTPVGDVSDAANSFSIIARETLSDAGTIYGPFSVQPSGRVPCRARGKNFVIQADLAGLSWTYFRGYDGIVSQPGGPR